MQVDAGSFQPWWLKHTFLPLCLRLWIENCLAKSFFCLAFEVSDSMSWHGSEHLLRKSSTVQKEERGHRIRCYVSLAFQPRSTLLAGRTGYAPYPCTLCEGAQGANGNLSAASCKTEGIRAKGLSTLLLEFGKVSTKASKAAVLHLCSQVFAFRWRLLGCRDTRTWP